MSDLMVTTMNDLPGHKVTEVFGEVFGLTVRSRHIGSDIGASLKGLVGGEIKGYTKMLAESRLPVRRAAARCGPRGRRERRHRDAVRLQRAREQHDRGRRLRHRGHGAARVRLGSGLPAAQGSRESVQVSVYVPSETVSNTLIAIVRFFSAGSFGLSGLIVCPTTPCAAPSGGSGSSMTTSMRSHKRNRLARPAALDGLEPDLVDKPGPVLPRVGVVPRRLEERHRAPSILTSSSGSSAPGQSGPVSSLTWIVNPLSSREVRDRCLPADDMADVLVAVACDRDEEVIVGRRDKRVL